MISITELAKLFKTTVRTIRYYEEIGLIEQGTRIKGKRYYHQQRIVERMNNIFFLKSLKLKLSDIELTLNNPFFIKPLIINIRLGLVRIEIDHLNKEVIKLKRYLEKYSWEEMPVINEAIVKEMKKQYIHLYQEEEKVYQKKQITAEEARLFVEFYKSWHEKVGIQLTEEHIRLIAFHPEIGFKEKKLKELFQKFFQED
ncbi:MerR family transcriptional regulator [Enterococcus faecalis]|uniref:MerR family transcriptional regulator n=1 Tax=Enterococcus faecalis TaxID=1351 RepID=UPI0020C77727|nr:MerR family transcriptional regulator [Enterococcus faecalis]